MSDGKAASSGAGGEDKNNLWSCLPSFNPQCDDPREYVDKVQSHACTTPVYADEGNSLGTGEGSRCRKADGQCQWHQTLLSAISTWEGAEELQVYEKFERVLYKTTQHPDETTQSYVNRLAVAFNEIDGRAVKDFRAFILLRQSALSVEDKKKVISMVGHTESGEG